MKSVISVSTNLTFRVTVKKVSLIGVMQLVIYLI